MKTLKIKLPFIYGADDYHEFDGVKYDIKRLSGVSLQYKELDADEYGVYYAVFYKGKCPSASTIKKLYNEL